MINEIKIFLFVLSIVYTLRFIAEFGIKLAQQNPDPLEVSPGEKIFLYFSLSYIITYILI